MGEVYRATDMRLKREAEVLASLNHPNIAHIHGLEESSSEAGHGIRALVIELVEGGILIDVQTAAGRTERWAVRGRPIAELEWTPADPPLKLGDLLTVVAYPAKPGADVNATIPAEYPRLAEVTQAGRLVYGIQLTRVDGSTLAF